MVVALQQRMLSPSLIGGAAAFEQCCGCGNHCRTSAAAGSL